MFTAGKGCIGWMFIGTDGGAAAAAAAAGAGAGPEAGGEEQEWDPPATALGAPT